MDIRFKKNLSILTHKSVASNLSEIWNEIFISDPRLGVFLIPDPDPGVKKAPDPGSATLNRKQLILSQIS